jgi:hypothetical protein
VVSVASLVVIIGIAIAPFFQQSIVFYSASVPDVGVSVKPLTAFASAAFSYTGTVGYVGDSFASYGM